MEEVVSNTIEAKHRFMVDQLLTMVLYEDEYEELSRRLSSWVSVSHRKPRVDGQLGDGEEDDPENANKSMDQFNADGSLINNPDLGVESTDDLSKQFNKDVSMRKQQSLRDLSIVENDNKTILQNIMDKHRDAENDLLEKLKTDRDKQSQALKEKLEVRKQKLIQQMLKGFLIFILIWILNIRNNIFVGLT